MMYDAKSLHAEFGTNFRLILFPGTCTRRLCEQHSSSCIFTAFCNSEPVPKGKKRVVLNSGINLFHPRPDFQRRFESLGDA